MKHTRGFSSRAREKMKSRSGCASGSPSAPPHATIRRSAIRRRYLAHVLASAPRSLRILVQVLLVVIVLGAAYLYVPAIGAVSPDSLQYSLARELDGQRTIDDGNTCVRRVADIWVCNVDD